jgi:hypothetical protein
MTAARVDRESGATREVLMGAKHPTGHPRGMVRASEDGGRARTTCEARYGKAGAAGNGSRSAYRRGPAADARERFAGTVRGGHSQGPLDGPGEYIAREAVGPGAAGCTRQLLAQEQELYVFAESRYRISKERSMRRRQLKWLWQRLRQLSTMSKLTREALLMKLGASQSKAPAAWQLVSIEVAITGASFGY